MIKRLTFIPLFLLITITIYSQQKDPITDYKDYIENELMIGETNYRLIHLSLHIHQKKMHKIIKQSITNL